MDDLASLRLPVGDPMRWWRGITNAIFATDPESVALLASLPIEQNWLARVTLARIKRNRREP